MDSVGVFVTTGDTQFQRSGPKTIDLKVSFNGFTDPEQKTQWRHKLLEVEDPLDLSADAAVKPLFEDALLEAAKAFDAVMDSKMAELGFEKER